MFELCLFDLDDTLLHTTDMDALRLSGKDVSTPAYKQSVRDLFRKKKSRHIYSQDFFTNLKKRFPAMKLGIFTRAPKAYTTVILAEAYPEVDWDIVITYDDVRRTKPYGDGIRAAMEVLDIDHLDRVVLIGDGDNDVRSAYNGGIAIVLDKSSWGDRNSPDNWRAINHMPDAIICNCDELPEVLTSLPSYSLELERLLAGSNETQRPRFDWIGKFIPQEVEGVKSAFKVFTCGRSFSNYESLSERRKWHALSESIQDNKDSQEFPEEWIAAIQSFIKKIYWNVRKGQPLIVTVVPHRPGRTPRLENMLGQLETAVRTNAFFSGARISFEPALLAYREGVRSQSRDFLNRIDRFINVRDHLFVQNPNLVSSGQRVLIIDDVCTTGASLIYAGVRLEEAGASETTRLSIAMNVGDVLPHD